MAILLAKWNRLSNFGRRPYEKHLGEIILNSDILFAGAEPIGTFL